MNNLAIIPARSGSKGLPDKNILPLAGKPMLAYSIEAALQSGQFGTVHVSTDSERYASIAREYGADVPFLRSAETASDTAGSWDVVREVLENYQHQGEAFDTVMLLQPTSPLRTSADIVCAYQTMHEKKAQAVVSVCEVEHSPLWCNTLPADACMDGFLPAGLLGQRQTLQMYYRINGAIYLLRVPTLREYGKLVYHAGCYAYIMPRERSVDIDVHLDFLFAETILCSMKDRIISHNKHFLHFPCRKTPYLCTAILYFIVFTLK